MGSFRRLRRRSLFLMPMLAGACLVGVALPTSAAEVGPIKDLAWLAGHWAGDSNGIAMEEHWTDVAGGGLVGMHKDVKNGKMASFEFFRIGPNAEGVPTYFTQPGGRPATRFVAVELSSSRVVFENAAHDFPQRIIYWREGDRLRAKIEGPMDGKTVSEEWSWGRVSPTK
jgi:hypothetical protein